VTTPHADEILTLADGRRLAWAEWGDPRGSPLVLLHPAPGSRLLCPGPAATGAAGVRLITVDRPGYGRSDAVANPTLAGFAQDLERLLDHLWIGRIRVVGWSAGGQYAAACAAALADRVSAVTLVATPAPDREVRWLNPPFREAAMLATDDPRGALAAAEFLAAPLVAAPERAGHGWVTPLDGGDTDPDAEEEGAFTAMWAEAFRAGAEGLAADLVAGARPWTFSTSHVRARAALFYGKNDSLIGPPHGWWWARSLPRARLSFRSGFGHLIPLTAWDDILRATVDPT
jgi:pimeloyl-ACP methyl ester carboxylesterase